MLHKFNVPRQTWFIRFWWSLNSSKHQFLCASGRGTQLTLQKKGDKILKYFCQHINRWINSWRGGKLLKTKIFIYFPFVKSGQKKMMLPNKKNQFFLPHSASFQFGHGAMQPLQLPVGISTPPPRSASSSARHRRTPSAGSATSAHRGATAAGGVVKDAVQVGNGVWLFFWLEFVLDGNLTVSCKY